MPLSKKARLQQFIALHDFIWWALVETLVDGQTDRACPLKLRARFTVGDFECWWRADPLDEVLVIDHTDELWIGQIVGDTKKSVLLRTLAMCEEELVKIGE